jgi:hypothetical protein
VITRHEVAERAVAAMRERAARNDSDGPREWGGDDPARSCARFSAMLRTGAAWVTERGVAASAGGPDSALWGYAAAEALDLASDGLPGEWVLGQSAPGLYVLEPA